MTSTLYRAPLVGLFEGCATDASVAGSKAAALARAHRAGLPTPGGMVLTTSWSPTDRRTARRAWRAMSAHGARPIVVRSSPATEGGAASSVVGLFESVLAVSDEAAFDAALATVLAWSGVLFGADPVTGRSNRLLVAAVPGSPAHESSDTDGWIAVLDRRGRVREVRASNAASHLPKQARRQVARLAGDAKRTFGDPQDIEWAIDHDGAVSLLQVRPIPALVPERLVVPERNPSPAPAAVSTVPS